jgi:hypothetical protein
MSTKPSRQDSLLAALQRKTSAPSAPINQEPLAHTPPESVSAPPPNKKMGKPVQFWLHETDRKTIRELAAWLAGQGIRPSDSMVIRAALQLAKPGPQLLDCYRSAALLDGRLKTHKV